MKIRTVVLLTASCTLIIFMAPAEAQDRASKAVKKFDADGEGEVSQDEFSQPPPAFKMPDKDSESYITLDEFRAHFGGGDKKAGGQRQKKR